MSFDRFEMEQQILKCWNVVDHLDLIGKRVADSDIKADDMDKLLNLTIGLRELYEIQFQELFATFECGIQERKIG